MKSIYTLLIISLVGFFLFTGITLVSDKSISGNNLDNESVNLVLKYDSQLNDIESTIDNNITLNSDYQPNNDGINEFFREYAEHKSRLDQLRSGVNLIYKLPDIILLSIPFIDIEDTSLLRKTFWILLIAVLFIAFIMALKGRVTDD